MAAIGIGAILLLLFLLGCTLAVIVATGAALVHGRFVLAAVIAGGSILFVFVAVGLISLIAFSTRSAVGFSEPNSFQFTGANATQPQSGWVPQVTVSHPGGPPYWRINLFPAVFVIGIGGFLLARYAKHHFAHAAAGHHSAWPVVAAIAIVAFLLLGGLRATRQNETTAAQAAAEANEQLRAQAETIAKQQQELTNRAIKMSNDIHLRIDKSDIFQLMDEFDAPRIVLQAPFTTVPSPAALVIAAAPSALQTLKKSTIAEESTSKTQSNQQSQSKSKKRSGSKPAAGPSAAATKTDQPPTTPTAPAPPSAPTPAAAPPVTDTPGPVPIASAGEWPNYKEGLPPAAAWHIKSRAAGKPVWIDNAPKRTGNVRREVMATEEYATADECYRAADIGLMLKAYDRIQELEGNPYPSSNGSDSDLPSVSFSGNKILLGGQVLWNGKFWSDPRWSLLNQMGIDPDFLRREIVAKDSKNNESCEFLDTVERSVGPMKKLYVQIEFTPDIEHELTRRWDAFHRTKHFAHVGLGAFSILSLLSVAWGLLKIDTATKGYYTKWLFVGAPIAIIGAAALSLLAFVGIHG